MFLSSYYIILGPYKFIYIHLKIFVLGGSLKICARMSHILKNYPISLGILAMWDTYYIYLLLRKSTSRHAKQHIKNPEMLYFPFLKYF